MGADGMTRADLKFLGVCLAFVLNAMVVWYFEHRHKE